MFTVLSLGVFDGKPGATPKGPGGSGATAVPVLSQSPQPSIILTLSRNRHGRNHLRTNRVGWFGGMTETGRKFDASCSSLTDHGTAWQITTCGISTGGATLPETARLFLLWRTSPPLVEVVRCRLVQAQYSGPDWWPRS